MRKKDWDVFFFLGGGGMFYPGTGSRLLLNISFAVTL